MRVFGLLLFAGGIALCLGSPFQILGGALIVSGAVFMGAGELAAIGDRQIELQKKLIAKSDGK